MVQQVELSTQMLLRPFFEFLDFVAMLFMGCFDCKQDGPHSSYEDPTALVAGTSFTASEVEALRELFRKLSSSVIDDGLIHKEELQLALFRNSSRENLFVDRVFDLFDAKHNGVIDFEEFVQSLSIFHPRAPQEEKVKFAFNLYDLRHTGFIEREEVEQMIIALLSESDLPLSDDVIAAILDKTFSEADTNKDGRIDSGEWHAFVARNPSLLKHMTLPYLNDLTIVFPSFNFNAETDDDL